MTRTYPNKEALFNETLALPPAERGVFLAKACGDDVDLLAEISALIAAHEEPDSLASPAQLTTIAALPENRPGDWIGRYRLQQQIGEGGCGVVWMAEQEEPVRRRVALKVIKLGMDTKAVIARFEAERQALAIMDHPHIAKVHDAGSTDTGRPYFVMELVRGIPITKYCDEHQLTPDARLELFIKVCQAVQHAHQKGIIHRDLKPSNILVTVNDGQPTPKVIDFGIAKATQGRLTDATLFTAFEQFIGTPVYMSPEQAEMTSLDIDTRSDIYSLGVLLYELLAGRPPFDPKNFSHVGVEQIRQQIRENEPPRPSARWQTLAEAEQTTIARQRGALPAQISGLLRGDLDWIVMRCLEKDRARRYETANGLAMDIQRHLHNEPVNARPPSTTYLLQKLIRRHRLGVAASAAVLTVIIIGAITTAAQATRALRAEREQTALREAARLAKEQETAARHAAEAEQLRNEKQRLARQHLLPEINRLTQAGDVIGAFTQALEAAKYLPDDPALTALWPQLARTVAVETTPTGASVYVKPYLTPKAEWQLLGTTPLKEVRLARASYRWQFRMEGYETQERATGKYENLKIVTVALDQAGLIPSGMVWVRSGSAGSVEPLIFGPEQSESRAPQVGNFFIDRHEVTNRQFKAFLDRGGYTTPTWWKPPFIKDDQEISWTEAVRAFRDATGRAGPATWMNGAYPTGEDEYPVAGISWYEAAAYAESVGKRLPSIHHWRLAARGDTEDIVRLSNVNGHGPAPVGSFQSMSSCGAYDLAGNVKEWCWNEAQPGKRYILGADSREPAYMYTHLDAQSPWDRSPANGFRCISLPADSTLDPRLDTPKVPTTRDFSRAQPASDEVYQALLSHYSYTPAPLDARIESTDDSSESVQKQLVSISAAYGGERLPVWLYLPKKAASPFQAVIYFPGSGALNQRNQLQSEPFIVESGRALIIPIFKGLYERGEGPANRYLNDQNLYPDFVIHCAKDFSRTIDYLQTRKDIRSDKLAFLGTSLGAAPGSILPAVENRRLQACVFVSGGINPREVAPHVDQVNFVPRIKVPTLMLNGQYDFIFTEPSQRQMFRLLGTPSRDKQHLLFNVGHVVKGENRTRETLAWLDRYLGPVR